MRPVVDGGPRRQKQRPAVLLHILEAIRRPRSASGPVAEPGRSQTLWSQAVAAVAGPRWKDSWRAWRGMKTPGFARQWRVGTLRHQDTDLELSHRAQQKLDKYRGVHQAHDLRHAFKEVDADSEVYCRRRSDSWRIRATLGLACAQAATLCTQVVGHTHSRRFRPQH